MKKNEKDDFDQFFRTRLISSEMSEVDQDWDRMRVILQRDKNKRVVVKGLLFFSTIAAVLLVFFFLIPGPAIDSVKSQRAKTILRQADTFKTLDSLELNPAVNFPGKVITLPKLDSDPIIFVPINSYAGYVQPDSDSVPAPLGEILAQTDTASSFAAWNSDTGIEEKILTAIADGQADEKSVQSADSRFSVALNISQDFNGVNNFKDAQIGYGIGAAIHYKIAEKLSVELGLGYSKKEYATDFSNYKPNSNYVFRVRPNTVNADCDVIDLQLNVNYKLLENHNSSFRAGIGLSSYKMLKEYYGFNYNNPYSRGPRSYSVQNENNHVMGIANLNFTYQRKVGNDIGLAFSPYLKLPISDIGYGNIRINTVGLNIGIIKELRSIRK